MAVMTKPTNAPGTSLGYITIGSVLTVLAGTSYFFFNGSNVHQILGYIRAVSLILGLVLLAIGFGVGHIGRVAREAEIAPPGVPTNSPADADPTRAANVAPVYTTTTRSNS